MEIVGKIPVPVSLFLLENMLNVCSYTMLMTIMSPVSSVILNLLSARSFTSHTIFPDASSTTSCLSLSNNDFFLSVR